MCVDTVPGKTRAPLPAYVKAVPTLMISGEPEPRTDGAVMNWLSERRLNERQSVTPGGFDVGLASAGDVGPAAFIDAEIFGGSDENYAFIGEDTNATSGVTARLTGNMASLDDLSSMMISDARAAGRSSQVQAPAQGQGQGQSKPASAKTKALDNAYEAFQAARNRDFPSGPQRR